MANSLLERFKNRQSKVRGVLELVTMQGDETEDDKEEGNDLEMNTIHVLRSQCYIRAMYPEFAVWTVHTKGGEGSR
jgi:hypothetical protein